MAKSGDVLDIPELGFQVTFRRTAAETGGELVEMDVTGRPRGVADLAHVHPLQSERHEPLGTPLKLVVAGEEHLLQPGDAYDVPAGTPHHIVAVGDGPGGVRLTMRPAGRTEAYLERMAQLSREGRILRAGIPRPVAGAEVMREFGDGFRLARPSAGVQRAMAAGILGAARTGRALRARMEGASGEYVFVDEWDVAAPPEAVFDALADARTYPRWWTPVYIDVDADGPPALGKVSRQHFKGRLPYHLHTISTITRLEPPRVVQGDVEGDLRGRGTWTLTPTPTGTHVRFDWRVFADRPLLRALTPVLRPVFRWNHNWAIARAMAGLESYARATSANAPESGIPSEDAVPSAG